jgi:L-alanine-DL-glutamate epimerase-like enolase superfamily enzyme
MKKSIEKLTGRRSWLKSAAGVLGVGFWADETLDAALQHTNTASKPSELKITDMRIADLPNRPIIRIDTNQGISGYGEVRDGASKTYALLLKARILNENPCNVDKIFRKIKQFGFHARQGGGVCGVEMALWDLAGKAYNVPVYQMLGGKFRDKIRVYADTPQSPDPVVFGERMKRRIEDGFTFLKMDVGIGMLRNTPGTITAPLNMTMQDRFKVHMLTGVEITDKGIGIMSDYLAKVREVVGWEVPIATDHFGQVGVNSLIRLGKAFTKFNLAWMEDLIPWQYPELLKKITDEIDVPTLTGEDIYLKEPFVKLCEMHAVDMIQPDLATSGGILETKKIGDIAQEYGVPMAMHMAGSPVTCFANVHCAAATENFLVLENHDVDRPAWGDIVDGVEKPIVTKGFIPVPEGPGLGFKINEEQLKKQVKGGYFEPTTEWDKERANDRLWS